MRQHTAVKVRLVDRDEPRARSIVGTSYAKSQSDDFALRDLRRARAGDASSPARPRGGFSGDARREHVLDVGLRDAVRRVSRHRRGSRPPRPVPALPSRSSVALPWSARRGVPPRARAATVLLEGARSAPLAASARRSPLEAPPPPRRRGGEPLVVGCRRRRPEPSRARARGVPQQQRLGAATGAIAGAIDASPSAAPPRPPHRRRQIRRRRRHALGALVGAAHARARRVARARGRRFALLLADGLYLVAALAMATAHTHRQLTFGRALAGVAVGVSTSLSALYISECAPARRPRGRAGSLQDSHAGQHGILPLLSSPSTRTSRRRRRMETCSRCAAPRGGAVGARSIPRGIAEMALRRH